MTTRNMLATLAFAAASLLPAGAQAQPFRAYLASYGVDGPACTLASPCRLLPAALAAVASGGEIWMLDSANYNTVQVNVTKSVTILAVPGALGSVVAAAGSALIVATGGVELVLRNLVIVPLPGGGATNGISLTAGASLTVEDCLVANLPGHGINVMGPAVVRVTDSTIRDNAMRGIFLEDGPQATITGSTITGNGNFGVAVSGATAGTTTTADVATSTLDANFYGLWASSTQATATVKVSIRDSRIVRNAVEGIIGESGGGIVAISASNNVFATNNGAALEAFGSGTRVWASGNTVADNNGTGLRNSGGLFESAGNNSVRNNAQDSVGTITVVATK